MALSIKQHGSKWRIAIDHEEWELDSRADLDSAIKTLLDLKEKKGQLFQKTSKSDGGCMADYGKHTDSSECDCVECCQKR